MHCKCGLEIVSNDRGNNSICCALNILAGWKCGHYKCSYYYYHYYYYYYLNAIFNLFPKFRIPRSSLYVAILYNYVILYSHDSALNSGTRTFSLLSDQTEEGAWLHLCITFNLPIFISIFSHVSRSKEVHHHHHSLSSSLIIIFIIIHV